MNLAIDKFFAPGGAAEQKLGNITRVNIRYEFLASEPRFIRESLPYTNLVPSSSKNGHAQHISKTNPGDKRSIITARAVGSKKTRNCHINEKGTGTISKNDPEF